MTQFSHYSGCVSQSMTSVTKSSASTSSIKYIDNFSVGIEFDHLFKCLLLGDSATGKSSLCERQVDRHFDRSHQSIPTCGVDFKLQAFDWEGKVVKLQIWDTAGQERFRAIVNSYYRGASGILLCYDITDPTTAENVKDWLIEVEKYAPVDIPIVLCGTKSDLQDDAGQSENLLLTTEIISDILASYPEVKHKCHTSAKTGEGVEEAFLKLLDCMLKHEAQGQRAHQYINQHEKGKGLTWSESWSNACGRLVNKPYASLMSGCSA